MANPTEQFSVKPLIPLEIGGYDVSFTNSSLFMVLAVICVTTLFACCLRNRSIIPSKAQCIPEAAYGFIASIIKDNIGVEGLKYFCLIFCIFLFVAFGNLLGMFPYAFTFTSHLAAVGGLSIIGLIFNICIGIRKKKLAWLRTFFPKGIPWLLAPVMVPIEIISFLSKPFSMTVRLVANMTVGHIMLKIIGGFIVPLGLLGGFIPMAFDGCIIVFEIFIAFLQAFIYTVLSCIYLGDALHSH